MDTLENTLWGLGTSEAELSDVEFSGPLHFTILFGQEMSAIYGENHCYFGKTKVKCKQKYLFTACTVGKSVTVICVSLKWKKTAHMLGPLRIHLVVPLGWCSPGSSLAGGFASLP